jgi:hypothetical protein
MAHTIAGIERRKFNIPRVSQETGKLGVVPVAAKNEIGNATIVANTVPTNAIWSVSRSGVHSLGKMVRSGGTIFEM